MTSDSLECVAMHPLTQISKLELGLGDTSLYFTVATKEIKKTVTLENLSKVYGIHIRSTVMCKRFYNAWNEILFNGSTSDYQSDISTKNITTAQSLFNDALEKEFSGHVLMYLDLNVLDEIESQDLHILNDKLFSYFPCWILSGKTFNNNEISKLFCPF